METGVHGKVKPTRVAWIDCARVLGIFFVCQVHSTAALPNPFLSRCAVCAFFLLAGYFNTKASVPQALKRSCIFLAAYTFWCVLDSMLSHEGVSFSLAGMWQSICYAPYPMWFIKYMIVLMPLGAALNCIPTLGRMGLAVALLVLSFIVEPVWDIMPLTWEKLVENTYPTYVLFLYMTGGILRLIPLDRLPGFLFPGLQGISRRYAWLGAATLLGALFILSCCAGKLPAPQLCYIGGIWALLFISCSLERCFPQAARMVAAAGPAVILVYLSNPLLLRIFASGYLHTIGELPPALLSCIVCVCLIFACTKVYRALIGRSRVLDAVLFAR